MPRGRKPTPAEVRTWLEQYDSGVRYADIAKRSGRAPNTVRKAIDAARREAESSEIRASLLRDAYRDHYADLLEAAERVRRECEAPIEQLRPMFQDRRSRLLQDALRSHIPRSPIWDALAESQRASSDLRATADNAKSRIEREARNRLGSQLPLAIAGSSFRNVWVDPLWKVILSSAEGRRTTLGESRILPEDGQFRAMIGAYQISERSDNPAELEDVAVIYRQLGEDVKQWDATATARDACQRFARAQELIGEDVELLLLRKLVPGTCRLCPV